MHVPRYNQIIPAQPGWEVIFLVTMNTGNEIRREPVIGWKINDDPNADRLTPITFGDRMIPLWGTKDPNGNYRLYDGGPVRGEAELILSLQEQDRM